MNFLKSIACASIVLALSACSEQESVQTYITQAEILIVEKQQNEAIISLKNALKVEAKNAHARFLLGRLYLNMGDAENAVKELERANQYKYDVNKVLPLLARAYILNQSDDDLLLLATQEESLTTVNNQYLAYKTLAALRVGDDKLAKDTVASMKSQNENDSYRMLGNAYLNFSQQDIEHARALVERIIMASPDHTDALMLRGQVASVEHDYSLAVDSFKKFQELQPKFAQVKLFIADALIKNKQYAEAEAIADEILAKVPTQPFMQNIKAMARFEEKDYIAANNLANQSISSGYNSFSLKLVAGASAFYLQNYDQSYLHLKDLSPYLSADHPARKMLAVSQLQLGFIDEIGETLSGYDATKKENSQFLATLSYELLEVGAYKKAQEMANQAAHSNEVSAEEAARTGVLKLMMNDPSGINNLELALEQNPELVSAELALAFASIKSGDTAKASKIATKWLNEYPKKAGGYNLKALLHFQENQLEQGESALDKSLQVEPNNAFALIQKVKLAAHQKKDEQAVILTEQALKAHPDNLEILGQYFSLHQNETGLEVIKLAQKNNINDVKYGVLYAAALMQLKQYKQASSVLDSYQVSVKTPKRYWQLALAANAQQPDSKDAFTIIDKWHKTNAYHIEPVVLLVDYWTNKRSYDRALDVLKRSFKLHPDNLILHLAKMQVLLSGNRGKEANVLLSALKNFDINEDLLAGIEGRILLLDQKYAAAIPKLKQHFKAKPTSSMATYLAFALQKNNQESEALELLESFSKDQESNKKLDARVSLTLANMYLANHQNKAIAEYQKIVKVKPDNIVALNNLSWLYMEQGKLPQALKYAKQAYEQKSFIPNVVDTYAQVLLKSEQKVEALAKAQEAYELSKGKDIDIALNLAESLLANNKIKEGRRMLDGINVKTAVQQKKKQSLSK